MTLCRSCFAAPCDCADLNPALAGQVTVVVEHRDAELGETSWKQRCKREDAAGVVATLRRVFPDAKVTVRDQDVK